MARPQDPRARERRLALAAALVCAAAAAVSFLPALEGEFVWDDQDYLLANPDLSPLGLRAIAWAATTSHAANWHPLTWLSHAVDVALFGLEPRGHHAVSVALHALNAALLMLGLWRLTGRTGPSTAVALLFALHPLHVESVAWVAERKDVLSTALMLLALHAWIGWVRRPHWARYAAVTLAFAAALASKPMVVTFPFVLLLFDAWPLRRLGVRAVVEKLPWLALSAASSALTLWAQGGDAAIAPARLIGLATRLETATVAYVRYLWHAAWPVDLGPFYPYPGLSAPPYPAWAWPAAAALLAAVTLLAAHQWRRRPWILVGWLFYLGTLVPVIGLVQVGRQALADRYTYVPLTGILLAVVWTADEARRRLVAAAGRRGGRRAARTVALGTLAAGLIVLAQLSALTTSQIGIWRDSEALWSHALRHAPLAPTVHFNLGNALLARGALEEAVASYRRSLERQDVSGQARAWYHIGIARGRQGRLAASIEAYRRAVALAPEVAPFRGNLANALYRAGQPAEAEREYRQALAGRGAPWEIASVHRNLAVLLMQTGRGEDAVERARQAVALDPSPANWEALAVTEVRAGRVDQAADTLRRGLTHHQGHAGLARRLEQLRQAGAGGPRPDATAPPEAR